MRRGVRPAAHGAGPRRGLRRGDEGDAARRRRGARGGVRRAAARSRRDRPRRRGPKGDVARAILETADEESVDLIIIGRQGLTHEVGRHARQVPRADVRRDRGEGLASRQRAGPRWWCDDGGHGSLVSRRQVLRGGAVAGAAVWLAPLLASCSDPNDSQLVFLNWQDYIDPTILSDFTDRAGSTVTYETYASNDELSNRLQLAGVGRRRGREGSSFDLIVPSDNLLRQLRTLDLLQELDTDIVRTWATWTTRSGRSRSIPGTGSACRGRPVPPASATTPPCSPRLRTGACSLDEALRGDDDDPRRDARRVRRWRCSSPARTRTRATRPRSTRPPIA